MATQLKNVVAREKKRNNRRQWCVRAFLLYLVGFTIFTNDNNKHIDLILLEKRGISTQ
jgi:hypothetical protein